MRRLRVTESRSILFMRSETLSDNPVARCSRWEGLARHVGQLSRTLPKSIVCDDAPELTSKATFFWAKRAGVKLHLLQPGNQTSVPSSNPSTANSGSTAWT